MITGNHNLPSPECWGRREVTAVVMVISAFIVYASLEAAGWKVKRQESEKLCKAVLQKYNKK